MPFHDPFESIASRGPTRLTTPGTDLARAIRPVAVPTFNPQTNPSVQVPPPGSEGIQGFFSDPRIQQALITAGRQIAGPDSPISGIGAGGQQFLQGRLEGELLGRLLAGEDAADVFGSPSAQALLPENRQNLLETFVQQRALEQEDKKVGISQQGADTIQAKAEGDLDVSQRFQDLRELANEQGLLTDELDRAFAEMELQIKDATIRRGQDLGLEGVRVNAEAIRPGSVDPGPSTTELQLDLDAFRNEFIALLPEDTLAKIRLRFSGVDISDQQLLELLEPADRQRYVLGSAAIRTDHRTRRELIRPGRNQGPGANNPQPDPGGNEVDVPGGSPNNPIVTSNAAAANNPRFFGQWIQIMDHPELGAGTAFINNEGEIEQWISLSDTAAELGGSSQEAEPPLSPLQPQPPAGVPFVNPNFGEDVRRQQSSDPATRPWWDRPLNQRR